ncbi:MAG: glutamate synthase large subunit [Candidatus Omnitrophica bacterium]|nr:glutamate synthase large subunit [Candidatus Omnitrophota bacterium]
MGPPPKNGLYDPAYEHDSCGVGFIADLKGRKSHGIISDALQILRNLEHRGACGCDALTGDGAGILLQTPHDFFAKAADSASVKLPSAGDYGTGLVFLPTARDEAAFCLGALERIVAEEGQSLLGWRQVPTDNSLIGEVARKAEPVVRQVFIGKGTVPETDSLSFERKLYVIRKRVENLVRGSGIRQKKHFYIPSLSMKTFIYKGLLLADQVSRYFTDLLDESMVSALALVHQRYSTNTFPTWDLAHPFRYLAHNGEINTLRGNINWMHARETLLEATLFGEDLEKLFPIAVAGGSDSAVLDNVLELLVLGGRSLDHAMMMLIPEPWDGHESMADERKAFYEYHACLMEPWDGPASIAFTDGVRIGAVLDRNGLRPSRYTVTRDDMVVMASETGVLPIEPSNVLYKGRLQPGRMFFVDPEQGRIIADEELKQRLIERRPYRRWLQENQVSLAGLPKCSVEPRGLDPGELESAQHVYGYSREDLRVLMTPMASDGLEPVGSMGNDIPLAVLSEKAPLLYGYFKQLFAQVTNPPLDAIREELVTSLASTIGSESNLFAETPEQCRLLFLPQPILTNEQVAQIKELDRPGLRSRVLSMLFPVAEGAEGMKRRLEEVFAEASRAIEEGVTILILSDRGLDRENMPIPSLLATAGLHHHLVREGARTRVGIVVESGEPREVHHFCLLVGYGAGAINPYVAFATLESLIESGELNGVTAETALKKYIKSINKGLLKVMSKMGISTLQSYRGAQIFEAVGLNSEFIERYLTGTPSRIEGVGIEQIFKESLERFRYAFPSHDVQEYRPLISGGVYQWRRDGEYHQYNPLTIAKLQEAVRRNHRPTWEEFRDLADNPKYNLATLRRLLTFRKERPPVPLEEVEPIESIFKRFKTGAMSFGSISKEAHETLAIAMNRIGGKSNTGEGGEDPARFTPDPNGDWRRSAIKQVASGRFGVTNNYLVNADELQIKMAQGAKPGEGGQLPGHKVDKVIAKTRYSTPGVQLISPPPHHDIYSIEDLAQLIHDLKNANRHARISVKLVAEVGVGTVAAGVAKGKSDVVLISGQDGGTGASPQTSIKHAGLPWELGLAETHQTLLANDLRSRIVIETDGQLKTAKDVAIAILLGAEEFGFATSALITQGCVMMRKCHLNTCPVGIATQDPRLRAKYTGKPEHLVNFFTFIAEDLRAIMAELGFRTVNEMVGHVECLDVEKAIDHWKAKGLDLTPLLTKPNVPPTFGTYCGQAQDHGLEKALDNELIERVIPSLERGEKVSLELPIRNINRTVGTMLSSEITRRFGPDSLEEDTVTLRFRGSAGQSFGAFSVQGIAFIVEGDANDYFGKGCSGSKMIIFPDRQATFVPEENILIGNVAFYGATSGEAYVRGVAGERFCVRNSGIRAVVEGVGDHGCEYMTGGVAVILGRTGRNFAAGMSGGIAYVLDRDGTFPKRCNKDMVELEELENPTDIELLRDMIEKHHRYTGSAVAAGVLAQFEELLPHFVKVMPIEYKRALAELERERERESAISEETGELLEVAARG